MTDSEKSTITYNHKSAQECQAFVSKLRSKARIKGPETFKAYAYAIKKTAHGLSADEFEKANTNLYDLIIDNTKIPGISGIYGSPQRCKRCKMSEMYQMKRNPNFFVSSFHPNSKLYALRSI